MIIMGLTPSVSYYYEPFPDESAPELVPCGICGRRFKKEALVSSQVERLLRYCLWTHRYLICPYFFAKMCKVCVVESTIRSQKSNNIGYLTSFPNSKTAWTFEHDYLNYATAFRKLNSPNARVRLSVRTRLVFKLLLP